MELQEFVKETLLQITRGVKEAQEAVKEYGGVVNPKQYRNPTDVTNAKINNEFCPVQDIDFEVALTSTTGKENKAGIGVALGSFKVGADRNNENKSVAATSVSFTVPLVFPTEDNGNTKSSSNSTIYIAAPRRNHYM